MSGRALRRMVWRAQLRRWARRYQVDPALLEGVLCAAAEAELCAELMRQAAESFRQATRLMMGREYEGGVQR